MKPFLTSIKRFPARCVLALIDLYRYFFSPLLGKSCRFHPTCSSYAKLAILRFGLIKGCWMTIKRIGRCHPWHEGGYDPVPERQN